MPIKEAISVLRALHFLQDSDNVLKAVVVVKWLACSPSTPTIHVQIPLTSKVRLFEKIENKTKRGRNGPKKIMTMLCLFPQSLLYIWQFETMGLLTKQLFFQIISTRLKQQQKLTIIKMSSFKTGWSSYQPAQTSRQSIAT